MLNGVILIDGGYVRAALHQLMIGTTNRANNMTQAPDAKSMVTLVNLIKAKISERLSSPEYRIRWVRSYYYDTDPYQGKQRQPDGHFYNFGDNLSARLQRKLISDLQFEDQFAVRKGVIKFRAWETTQSGYRPIFQQKGVDMKIGLDIAWLATKKIADVIVLVTADSDFVSPMKLARREGAIVCICTLTDNKLTPELAGNADIVVKVEGWVRRRTND